MNNIVQVGDEVLRGKAEEVPVDEIRSKKIQTIIKEMKEVLDRAPDGAALAAPQIGVSLRIFILASKVFGPESEHEAASNNPHHVYINPVIIKRSSKKEVMDEGCLSVRGKYGNVRRSKNVTLEAYDENGEKFVRGAGGLLAQAFQHECDHLDGKLFFDTAEEIWDIDVTTEKQDNTQHENE